MGSFYINGIYDWLIAFTAETLLDAKKFCTHVQKEHVDYIKRLSKSGGGMIDSDTYACPETYDVALLAAGGVMMAGDEVMKGNFDNAFALIRPPGHHASRNRAAGFCYFNNVAIMIRYVQEEYKIKRVLLLDWDTHASDGTTSIFYEDPTVLNISIHQDPHFFYPGSGFIEQIGSGKGKGYTINVPVPGGTADADYAYIFDRFVIPKATKFEPELVVISAGQDSHRDDYISSICLTEAGYANMTSKLMALAKEFCNNRLVVELEGGYNLNALKKSNHAIVSTLLGIHPSIKIKGKVRDSTLNVVENLNKVITDLNK